MIFIDTNIFIYAHDETEIQKSQKARELLIQLTNTKEGCISTQVIQEFCNVALKKSVTPLKVQDVRTIVLELMTPLLAHRPDAAFYLKVLETYERYSLSFYDSAIVQAAIDLNCTALYTEDLQAGATYGKVKVVNPFV
ncbi:MAG TPA: PIN domain-containing protein [Candidatus Saccharimonadales bacterium]|nr:PIN domain-containing protein [Candidatus Saccharimonadales bacterium]